MNAFVGPPSILAVGAVDGPLSGTSLAVKDMFDIAGFVTGAGNPRFAADHAPADGTAPAVEMLVAAGATVVGKTITDELAYSLSGTNVHFGSPINVAARGRVPGGSSAGSAAAVAAGLVDLALGTDTGGSVRVPASYCGIVGFRPSHGAVPIDRVVPLAPSFDTVGLFARDLDLLVAAAEVLLSRSAPSSGVPSSRLVLLREALDDSSADVAAEVARVGTGLGAVEAVSLGIDLAEAMRAFRARQGWEAWQAHGKWITARAATGGAGFGRGIAGRFEMASAITLDEVAAADVVRERVSIAVQRATANGTVLVMPAAAGPAPEPTHVPASHELQRSRTLRLTCIAGLSGAPVVVLPMGGVDTGDGRLPLGIAFVGAPGSDRQLLQLAVRVQAEHVAATS